MSLKNKSMGIYNNDVFRSFFFFYSKLELISIKDLLDFIS